MDTHFENQRFRYDIKLHVRSCMLCLRLTSLLHTLLCYPLRNHRKLNYAFVDILLTCQPCPATPLLADYKAQT